MSKNKINHFLQMSCVYIISYTKAKFSITLLVPHLSEIVHLEQLGMVWRKKFQFISKKYGWQGVDWIDQAQDGRK
jgi:hypothetical protein